MLAAVAILWTVPRDAEAAEVRGELRRWHRVEMRFAGPPAAEGDSSPNPFLDDRLQCRITAPSGRTWDVPGFFDANGGAGTSGSLWVCRFSPDEIGQWRFVASFRVGTQVAVSTSASAGTPASFDGDAGTFTVIESDKKAPDFRAPDRGLLVHDGHYLVFAGSGTPWLKGGTNIPENFLGYSGFDNTPDAGHDFAAHAADWKPGDPDWGGGAGKAIIGALNWLAAAGANSIYFLPMNVGGDGDDTFPTVATGNKTHYDTSKLRQWETVFAHADRVGVFLHFQLSERESANETYHDGGSLGPQRKLYYRELIARFGHHLGVQWNVGEENNYGTVKRRQFAEHLRALDPYDHPVTTHTKNGQLEEFYEPLLGNDDFSTTSFQTSASGIGAKVADWRRRSAEAGAPWVISVDEPQPIENDVNDASRGYPHGRRSFLWPIYLSGGGGFEWYVQEDGGGHGFDQRVEDLRPLASALAWTRHARAFMEALPLASMRPAPELSDAAYSLAAPGSVYAIYAPSGGTREVDLAGAPGSFEVRWFNPRTGAWHDAGTVTGGGVRSIGAPPFAGDAAAVVRSTAVSGPPAACAAVPRDGCSPSRAGLLHLVRKEDGRRRLTFKWLDGSAVSTAEWGDPRSTTAYRMCVYDGRSGYRPVLAVRFPIGAGWVLGREGNYAYRDRGGAVDGLRRIVLRPGTNGRARIALKAQGEALPDVAVAGGERMLAHSPGVVVQVVRGDGTCWETSLPAASVRRNKATVFKAQLP